MRIRKKFTYNVPRKWKAAKAAFMWAELNRKEAAQVPIAESLSGPVTVHVKDGVALTAIGARLLAAKSVNGSGSGTRNGGNHGGELSNSTRKNASE